MTNERANLIDKLVLEAKGLEPELFEDETKAYKRQGELAEAGTITSLYRYTLMKEPVRWLAPHHMGVSQCSCGLCLGTAKSSRFRRSPI